MKRIMLSLITVLALAIGAGAQGIINFGDMPSALDPSPMPNSYANLNWTGFFYVNPFVWEGAGPGFRHADWMGGSDVVFAPYACPSLGCYASLSVPVSIRPTPNTPQPPRTGFMLVSTHAAAGYPTLGPGGSPLVVTAYYNGRFVGSHTYMMDTNVRQLDFPTEWGVVTQVIFQGSVVFYDLNVYTLGY